MRMVDEYDNRLSALLSELKPVFTNGLYTDVYGFLQFMLRDKARPVGFDQYINRVLERCQSSYWVFDGDTLAPIAMAEVGLRWKAL